MRLQVFRTRFARPLVGGSQLRARLPARLLPPVPPSLRTSISGRFLIAAWAALAACSRPVATARLSHIEPAAPAEVEARAQLAHRACSPRLAFLFPGLGQLCLRKTGEGSVLASLAAMEVGTTIAVAVDTRDGSHPGVTVPLAALQDLYVYGIADVGITEARARGARYAPRDSLTDLVAAPLNWQVMKRPGVWAGTALALAGGIALSLSLSDEVTTDHVGEDPNLFGETVDRRTGYPAAGAAGVVLFGHVAIAEEALFRGWVQSGAARSMGETQGWLAASLLFGVAHVPNIYLLPEEDRADYLLYGIPFITAAGAYLGWLYRAGDYSLAPPVAVHFWYDFLLSATLFALDPQHSIFSTSMAIPF